MNLMLLPLLMPSTLSPTLLLPQLYPPPFTSLPTSSARPIVAIAVRKSLRASGLEEGDGSEVVPFLNLGLPMVAMIPMKTKLDHNHEKTIVRRKNAPNCSGRNRQKTIENVKMCNVPTGQTITLMKNCRVQNNRGIEAKTDVAIPVHSTTSFVNFSF
jgi:hypothetical protein